MSDYMMQAFVSVLNDMKIKDPYLWNLEQFCEEVLHYEESFHDLSEFDNT